MAAEQQQSILVTVRPAAGRVFASYAVVVLAPESLSPATFNGFTSPDEARVHAQKHWPAEQHVAPNVLDAEVARRRPSRRRR